MKTKLFKKSIWQSLLSAIVFGIFLYIAFGSIGGISQQKRDLGNGVFEVSKFYGNGKSDILIGKVDGSGRWHGKITIEYHDEYGDLIATEKVTMVHGKRDGESKTIYPGGNYSTQNYRMGERIPGEKSARISETDTSAFKVLNYKYQWYVFKLNIFGFDNEYIEAYLDTLENLLATYTFDYDDFDDYYEEVITALEDTPYDSIISLNAMSTLYHGLELMKDSEFRLAVIDKYRLDSNTFDIVKVNYPGYLQSLQEAEVTEEDFKEFCRDFDDTLSIYGALDTEDSFFIDSVDARIFRALNSMYSSENGLKSKLILSQNEDLRTVFYNVKTMLNPTLLDAAPNEVAQIVLFLMFMQFEHADIIDQAVRKAYLIKNDIISIPTVTTEFSGNNSPTSVTLNGYVIEDGGGTVTSRGISWATFYNPTINETSEDSGSGTGDFSVTLNGLTEGTTYYARTYAINSAGTAYGNCITFTAEAASKVENTKSDQDFRIYPNPASGSTTFSFQLESAENLVLTIVDLKGRIVLKKELGSLSPGKIQVEMDLASLRDGMYSCRLTSNGAIKVTRKLIVAR